MAKRTRPTRARPAPAAKAAPPPSSPSPSAVEPAPSASAVEPAAPAPSASAVEPASPSVEPAPPSDDATPAPAVPGASRAEPVSPATPRGLVRAARPRFWHDFELPWAQWVGFRFVFFGLHAVDAFLQISHAPRYGAGGFNVQQLPSVPLPDPSRAGLTFVYGALCVLFALVAQGVAVRWILPVATALYGYAYFVSQLDSYQHHYLMWLLLVLLCFVPAGPAPAPAGARVAWQRSWALRLVLVQVAIVYLWAAVAKLDPVWLDGTSLTRMVSVGWIKSLLATIGPRNAAVAVVVVEVTLALALWNRVLWPLALGLGVGLHVGIELIGVDIGLFSYFMLALYLLLVPAAAFLWLWRHLARAGRAAARLPVPARALVAAVVAIGSLFVILRHPLPLAPVAAVIGLVAVARLAPALYAGTAVLSRRLAELAVAVALLAFLLTTSGVAADHFRTWGGASRRLRLATDERAAYEGLLQVDPSSEYGHYYLGQLEVKAERSDAAIAHFRRAQAAAPAIDRSYLAESAAQLAAGRRDDARAALERGIARVPDAAALRARLEAIGGP